MDAIREELIYAVFNRITELANHTVIPNEIDRQYESAQKTILAEKSITEEEKLVAIKVLNINYNGYKVSHKIGAKRFCENCQKECIATHYCENCVRQYLKVNFSNQKSGNDNIDYLIQECQTETLAPYKIIEWIPYSNLQDVEKGFICGNS